MNIEKMTTMMQQSLAQAQEIAQNRKHQEIDVSHLWKVFLTPNHFGEKICMKDVRCSNFRIRKNLWMKRLTNYQ